MESTDADSIATNSSSFIRKKSSFLRDGSYRVFHIAQQTQENSTGEANNQADSKSIKTSSTLSLNHLFYLQATACETTSSIATKASLSSQSVVYADEPSVNLSDKLVPETVPDEANERQKSFVRTSKPESPNRKQVLVDVHPDLQASFHRRRQRFIVACGTVTVALSVIITITVYVTVMTVKYIAEMNQPAVHRHPRI